MFGLMRVKEHQKHLHELERLLGREKARSLFWNLKCVNPKDNPVVLGSKEDIKYITKNNVVKTN